MNHTTVLIVMILAAMCSLAWLLYLIFVARPRFKRAMTRLEMEFEIERIRRGL